MYRAGLLAAYGWPAALDRMSRHSAWEGADAIRFSSHAYAERRVSEEGMQFVPVTLARGTWLCEWRPAEYALIYPARGVADRGPEPTNSGVDRLLGRGRARILRELRRPATNSELAFELGLSLGTVGGHLAVLRGAGMITGSRVGRRVVYFRTDTADLLLNAQSEADDWVSSSSSAPSSARMSARI